MAKRSASKQLTQDNWDEEDDEKETPGMYRSVEASILQNRVIKRAKRSLPSGEDRFSSLSSRSPFSQFSGFGSTAGKTQPFGFLKSNCEKSPSQGASIEKHENGSKALKTPENLNEPSSSAKDSSSSNWKICGSRDVEYYRQLKALNESLMQWIKLHILKNPWCDFTPVFDDYKKHLSMIEKKYPLKVKPSLSSHPLKPFSFKVPLAPVQKTCNATPEEKFGSGDQVSKVTRLENSTSSRMDVTQATGMCYGAGFRSSTTNTSTFSSGIKATTTATVPSSNSGPTSSCSSSEKDAAENEQTPSFSFSVAKSAEQSPDATKPSGKPDAKLFTFAVSHLGKSKDSDSRPNNETNEDDEYVPPKNQVTIVEEEGAVYSKKCRLFYKKDDSYMEKGVGMLHLKPMDGNTQLLIRADTNLGNILLNIELRDSLPMQRMGKNNVLVVCVPNPPIAQGDSDKKETAPFLIRVKTGEDADELLDMLNKYKS